MCVAKKECVLRNRILPIRFLWWANILEMLKPKYTKLYKNTFLLSSLSLDYASQ